MGARLSIDYVTYTPSPSFVASEAAQVTIDELGKYGDPNTGLERKLDEACASDEEKERMRSFVQNALVVLHDQEHDELHALVLEASREATARLLARAEENLNRHDPFGDAKHRPRHSRMSLTACQSRPAIDTAIYYPNSTLYQLQPSFHTSSTEPEPTARARRAGEEFY
jgi:hypothetical protein